MGFRIYDKKEKKYVRSGMLIDMDGKLYDNITYSLCDPDRYAVEFSTGLKDKSGKEIFEGDVVKDEYGQINPIKFHYGSFWANIVLRDNAPTVAILDRITKRNVEANIK